MTIELTANGARALIEPAFGGRLHQLFVDVRGREAPLLYSPEDPASYAAEPLVGGCYPMAPWPNRIRHGNFEWRGNRVIVANGRENALHGLVLDRPWEVVARVGRVVEMTCDFGPGWPWEGKAWQRIELGPNFLALKMEVRSARETFPAGCGWHPWFRRGLATGPTNAGGATNATVSVMIPAQQRYELDRQLPTGALRAAEGGFALDGSDLAGRRLDDCYTNLLEPKAVITWPGLRLTMTFDCAFPHVQVYTPPEAFCIEPQTCAPDAFNLPGAASGAAVVAPGRPLSFTMRWTWEATEA
ncbi:MAG: hypothetical protein ABI577_09200 [bacterium]